MERIDLRKVIQETVGTFNRIRIGDKPPLYLGLTDDAGDICWPDPNLNGFVRIFLYETLLTNSPNMRIEVLLSRRAQLRDLAKFVGIYPSCWIHLRVCGRGLGHAERLLTISLTRPATSAKNGWALKIPRTGWGFSPRGAIQISRSSSVWNRGGSNVRSRCCSRNLHHWRCRARSLMAHSRVSPTRVHRILT
jgi:hypothetical protein